MAKKLSVKIDIPKPCTENWENMTANERGRHCSNCNKTVIDFSLYSDKQLIEFFSKTTENICGRINSYQLQKQLVYVEPKNNFLYKVLFGTAISLGLVGSANANYNPNTKPLIEQHYPELQKNKQEPQTTGGDTLNSIHGMVIDSSNHEPLPFATIILLVNGTQVKGQMTDIDGKFMFDSINQYDIKQLFIKVVYPGYADNITPIKTTHLRITVTLKMNAVFLGAVIMGIQQTDTPPDNDLYRNMDKQVIKGEDLQH
jgi:hypothetical protein